MPMMIKLGYFGEAEKKLIRFGGEETIPKPENDEVVVYRSFFKAGLRFPLHEMIEDVLKDFKIYLHQLTPNAIVRLSVFILALRSQGVEPLAEAFCRVHELHYQTKAREDGLHENFGCYNFAYRKDMKTLVVSYRTKWPTGWKNEWFYVKVYEKKEKLVQSPLDLTFGLTRPLCDMLQGSLCWTTVGEFRVVSEHIGTRDLMQEYLANRVFLTLKEWNMPKLKEEKKKNELVRLPYHFKFKKHFKEPCQEWLEMIEAMCNEILGNYTKKEDQLMTAAFGTRPKRRLNRVMDALKFEYLDYERLSKGAEGPKRKRVVSVMKRQAARMIEEDEKSLKKKKKFSPEPKVAAPKKRKASATKPKTTDIEEEIPSTPSVVDVEEILKVMTKSLPLKLSPLGPQLMKLLQKKEEPATIKKPAEKRRRIITVFDAIEETPPPASASKTPAAEDTTATEAAPTEAATAEAKTVEDTNLEGTFSDIDKMILNMVAEEAATAAEETLGPVPRKEKEIAKDTSKEKDFNFQDILGQKMSKVETEELRDYAISCGYQLGAMLFGGVAEESLGCLRDRIGAKIVSTLSKSVGFLKLEADLSRYRRQHIADSLFYANFKVKFLPQLFIVFEMKVTSDEGYFFRVYY
jgi:hypothetical protein